MRELSIFLLFVIVAQGLGVGLALGADAASCKWRPSEFVIVTLNCICLMVLFPSIAALLLQFSSACFPSFLAIESPFLLPIIVLSASLLLFFWLFLVAWVQKIQLKISLRAAFSEALLQFSFFTWAMSCAVMLLSAIWLFLEEEFVIIWLVSTILTYALLSLFRPTLYGTWNLWRENSRKNRPLR